MNRRCPICENAGKSIFCQKILKKYDVEYYQCAECKAIYTEEPFWLNEAYQEALTSMDTGVISRNIHLCQKTVDLLRTIMRRTLPNNPNEVGGGRLCRRIRHHDAYAKRSRV